MPDCICQTAAESLAATNPKRDAGGWRCPVHGQIDYADVIIRVPKIRRPPAGDRVIREKVCPTCQIEREETEAGDFYCIACKIHF